MIIINTGGTEEDPHLLNAEGHATVGQVIVRDPSPEEIREAAAEIERVRMLLSEARSRLSWLGWGSVAGEKKPGVSENIKYGEFRDLFGVKETTECVEGALSPLIAYLYPLLANLEKRAAFKEEALAHPEIYVIEDLKPQSRCETCRRPSPR